MRKAYSSQRRLDCEGVLELKLNLNCRDEIVPVLRALQPIYADTDLRQEILDLVAQDVNEDSGADRGREGMDYWQVLVLAAVRLGCNLDIFEPHTQLYKRGKAGAPMRFGRLVLVYEDAERALCSARFDYSAGSS